MFMIVYVFIIQKKTIRAINFLPYKHHTHEYFKSMKLLKIYDLYKVKILSHMLNHFDQTNYTSQSEIHSYNTRNRGNNATPFFNTSQSIEVYIPPSQNLLSERRQSLGQQMLERWELWNSVSDEIK